MSFGFKVIGTSGSVQVDELYKNLSLVASGTLTETSTHSGSVFPILSYTGTSPVIAFACSEFYVAMYTTNVSGNVWSYSFLLPGWTSGAFTLKWWIFDVPPSTSLPAMGLIVKDSTDQITFRSDLNYMRVEDYVSPAWGSAVESWTKTAGKTYAVAVSGNIFGSIPNNNPPPNFILMALGVKVVSNVIYKQWTPFSFFAGGFSGTNAKMMIMDVTGF